MRRRVAGVITSYSIHYTKLYDLEIVDGTGPLQIGQFAVEENDILEVETVGAMGRA